MNELERVNKIAETNPYAKGVNYFITNYSGEIFKRFLNAEENILEIGPAEGVMTEILYPHFKDYTVVDGAEVFVEALKKRYPKIHGYAKLFENFDAQGKKFHNIVLGHVLEHVENPVEILSRCKDLLPKSGGRIVAAVPNSNSIHRQAAVLMGLLKHEKQLNDTDKINGHRRVYDMPTFQADFIKAGLKIIHSGGYWLKPLSNAQIERDWTREMIDAFFKLGEKYPDIAAEIYVVATN